MMYWSGSESADLADVFVRCEAADGLEPSSEVIDVGEVDEVPTQLIVAVKIGSGNAYG
jgi:hypothetical protein